jgi:DNA-binding response OmpR family regulator
MVVDDDPGILDTYSAWLSDEYDVTTASSGEEALNRINEDVSVVLLDRRMPGVSGREALKQIREAGYGVRVAVVTAVEPDFEVIDMGFDAYLVKPVARGELTGAVEDLLQRVKYTDKVLDYHSLVSKKVLLEEKKTEKELAESKEYAELLDRLKEVESRVDELSRSMTKDGFEAVVRDIQKRA